MTSPVVSFNFPQLAGPQVDTMLFPKAAAAGVSRGNAEGSAFGDIVRGGIQGGKDALAFISGVQSIQTQAQQQELNQQKIDNAPAQQAQEAARTQQMELQNQILQSQIENGGLELEQRVKKEELQLKATQIQEKNQDLGFFDTLSSVLGGDPENAARILTQPDALGSLMRNPERSQQVFAGLRQSGVDESVFATQEAAVNGALSAKEAARREASYAEAARREADKRTADYQKSVYDLSPVLTSNGIKAAEIDPTKLDVVANNRINFNKLSSADPVQISPIDDKTALSDVKGYSLVYNGKILTQYDSTDAATKARNDIANLRSYAVANNLVPQQPVTNSGQGQAPTESVQRQGVNNPAGFAAQPTSAFDTGLSPNETIKERVNARFKAGAARATQLGIADSYNRSIAEGSSFAPAVPALAPVATLRQDQPVPPNQPRITQPVGSAINPAESNAVSGVNRPGKNAVSLKPTTNIDNTMLAQHAARLLGVPATRINLGYTLENKDYAALANVAKLPALQDYNALIKGMAAVESAGNPRAVSPKGAKGLMQLMPAAMQDVGGVANPFDAQQSARGGAAYMQQMISQYNKAIIKESAKQGIPIQPDIRLPLLAVNGGMKYVKEGLAKGYTTWEEMRDYMLTTKSKENALENVTYAEKVIAFSIPFMVGGNAADDSLMKSVLNSGIVEPVYN